MPAIQVGDPATKRRRMKVAEAQAHVQEHLGGRFPGRKDALATIDRADNPMRRARELVAFHQRRQPTKRKARPVVSRSVADHSDGVARLVNRDGCVCPVHREMIRKLDLGVAGGMSASAFEIAAGHILSLPQALPKGLMEDERRRGGMGSQEPDLGDPKSLTNKAPEGPLWRDRWGYLHRRPTGYREVAAHHSGALA